MSKTPPEAFDHCTPALVLWLVIPREDETVLTGQTGGMSGLFLEGEGRG